MQAYFEGTFVNARNAAMCEFMGSEATLYIDRGRYEVIPNGAASCKPSELILGDGPRGADFYDKPDGELLHLANWIECIRTRKKPALPGGSRRQRRLRRPTWPTSPCAAARWPSGSISNQRPHGQGGGGRSPTLPGSLAPGELN